MRRIEGIRPGASFSSSFAEQPFAEFLLGVLRASVTGALTLGFHDDALNRIYFRHGVVVLVDLPSVDAPSLKERVLDAVEDEQVRTAVDAATTDGEVAHLVGAGVLPATVLLRAWQQVAEGRLLRLFDVGDLSFVFQEGQTPPGGRALTVLKTLPLVFRGLRDGRFANPVLGFMEANRKRSFALSGTYPTELDIFEWGPDLIEAVRALEKPQRLAAIAADGDGAKGLGAALMSLYLVGMLDERPVSSPPRTTKRDSTDRPTEENLVASRPDPAAPDEPSGLRIHRRSEVKLGGSADREVDFNRRFDVEYMLAQKQLGPYRNLNYFEILRVRPDGDAAQIERAFRFLIRQTDSPSEPSGAMLLKSLYHEAFEHLRTATRASNYRRLLEEEEVDAAVSAQRRQFEAEPKVERAVRAIGNSRHGEAQFLLEWGQNLDPTRADLPVLLPAVRWLNEGEASGDSSKATVASLAAYSLAHPEDRRAKLVRALVLAQTKQQPMARQLLREVNLRDHALWIRVQSLVGDV